MDGSVLYPDDSQSVDTTSTASEVKPPDKPKKNAAPATNRDSIDIKSPNKRYDFKLSTITGVNLVELRSRLGHGSAISDTSLFVHLRLCWLEAIANNRSITNGATNLAICLNGSFNGKTAQCYKSVSTLAKELGVSIETIRRYLRALEAAGYLHTLSRAGNYRQNIYYPDFRLTTPHKELGTTPTLLCNDLPQTRGRISKNNPYKNTKAKSNETEQSSTEDFMNYAEEWR
ncbi:helix-turn-helix domain-containing protein [Ahrensia kielensis]|uniref:helix-turn-helix domain-containing protein n=1 Tax=Ahrensia kielensis TaxID=76980 RepID=UPI000373F623|nr:helix-turn-helix domain-containing protein [Ahrensia kielensis]